MNTTPDKRVTRASRKRSQSSAAATSAQGPLRKKRSEEPTQIPVVPAMDMKENTVMMERVSVGLHMGPPILACKENLSSDNRGYFTRSKSTLEVTRDCFLPPPGLPDSSQALSSRPLFSLLSDIPPFLTGHRSPLPVFQWARSAELWGQMRDKDVVKSAPEADLQLRHPGIVPSMRVILLDWMLEVCEEYRLHRETYYLAKDMFDRFMDLRSGVLKDQLQLIGVTCLFISSKIEEIYPPKVGDFAYVTDGACSVASILNMELVICKTLKWRLNHSLVTVNTWVNTYMQIQTHHTRPPGLLDRDFELPSFSPLEFIKIMQLLDLCTLDMNSRQFGASILAASALYLASERSRPHLPLITGFELNDVQVCVNWMHPFAIVFSQKGPVTQKAVSGVVPQDSHNIQTHDISMSMMDDAHEIGQSQELSVCYHESSVFMTPPRSERRCLAPINTTC